jgi:hypothetical protein
MLVLAELLDWNAALVIGTPGKVGELLAWVLRLGAKKSLLSGCWWACGETARCFRGWPQWRLMSFVSALRKGGAGLDQLQQPLHESLCRCPRHLQ